MAQFAHFYELRPLSPRFPAKLQVSRARCMLEARARIHHRVGGADRPRPRAGGCPSSAPPPCPAGPAPRASRRSRGYAPYPRRAVSRYQCRRAGRRHGSALPERPESARSSPALLLPGRQWLCREVIRTLKENLLWVQAFNTIEDLRQALLVFRQSYNATWLIAGTSQAAIFQYTPDSGKGFASAALFSVPDSLVASGTRLSSRKAWTAGFSCGSLFI
jgi:hypothetical protein